jgi:hypothetical protein
MSWEDHENRALFKRGLKRCSKCRKIKKLDDFHKANPKLYKTGRKSACKLCLGTRNPMPQKKSDAWFRAIAENKRLVEAGKKRCARCGRVKSLRKFWKNKVGIGGYRTVCVECDEPNTRLWTRRWNRKNREEAIAHYGGKCTCCGESRFEFLAINHKGPRGTGNRQRKSGEHKPGNGFIKWLKRNGWPKDFDILCHNCNQAIGFYGYCPHKGTKSGKRAKMDLLKEK